MSITLQQTHFCPFSGHITGFSIEIHTEYTNTVATENAYTNKN